MTKKHPTDTEISAMRRECKAIIAAHRTGDRKLTYDNLAAHFGVNRSSINNTLNSRNNFQSIALLSVLHGYLTANYGFEMTH